MVDPPDTTATYRETRERVIDLLDGLAPAAADGPVPACPRWRVRDVAAHLVGVTADILAGRLDGVATDPWTAAQVDARRDRPLADVLDEWRDTGPKLEAQMGPGGAPAQLVFDEVTHEHDLRGALGAAGARDSDAVTVALDFVAGGFGAVLDDRGLPPLRLRGDGGQEWRAGAGEAAATVAASSFDLLRSASGRRSAEQIAALDWDSDPAPYLAAFTYGPFTLPAEPLDEG